MKAIGNQNKEGRRTPGEKKASKIVFIGIDLPRDILKQGLEQCLV